MLNQIFLFYIMYIVLKISYICTLYTLIWNPCKLNQVSLPLTKCQYGQVIWHILGMEIVWAENEVKLKQSNQPSLIFIWYITACAVFMFWLNRYIQRKWMRTIFTGMTYKLLSSFMAISDVYRCFIANRTTVCLLYTALLSGFQVSMGALSKAGLAVSHWPTVQGK